MPKKLQHPTTKTRTSSFGSAARFLDVILVVTRTGCNPVDIANPPLAMTRITIASNRKMQQGLLAKIHHVSSRMICRSEEQARRILSSVGNLRLASPRDVCLSFWFELCRIHTGASIVLHVDRAPMGPWAKISGATLCSPCRLECIISLLCRGFSVPTGIHLNQAYACWGVAVSGAEVESLRRKASIIAVGLENLALTAFVHAREAYYTRSEK